MKNLRFVKYKIWRYLDDFSPVRTRSSCAKKNEKVNEDAILADERNDEEQSKTSEETDNENLLNSEVRRKSKSNSSRTSSKRKPIKTRKAAKLTQITLKATKNEAELRA